MGSSSNMRFFLAWKADCDNEALVCVLSTNHTRNDLLGAFACSIWAYTASKDIQLQYSHIAG